MSFYDGVKWVGDIFYSPVRGASYIFTSLSSCPAYAIGASDGERCFFNYRLGSQLYHTNISLLSSNSPSNPIYIMTEIILGEAKHKDSKSYALELTKILVKYGIKKVTLNVLYTEIAAVIVSRVMTRYFAGKAVKTGVVTGVSMGVGAVLSGTSIMSEAHSATMRLKAKNIVIYNKLKAKNVECFWLLAEEDLKGFVY